MRLRVPGWFPAVVAVLATSTVAILVLKEIRRSTTQTITSPVTRPAQSQVQKDFAAAYWHTGGAAELGSPINSIHPWGATCTWDFEGGRQHKSAIMAAITKADATIPYDGMEVCRKLHPRRVVVIMGDIWDYYENKSGCGEQAVTRIGIPTNNQEPLKPSASTMSIVQDFRAPNGRFHSIVVDWPSHKVHATVRC